MRKKKHPEHVNHERWLISYADFITLLFAFFVVMFAVSQVDTNRMGRFTEEFSRAVGIELLRDSGRGLLPGVTPAPALPPQGMSRGGDTQGMQEFENLRPALLTLLRQTPGLRGLQVLRRRNEIILRMPDNVFFESGAATLRLEAVRALIALAAQLRERRLDIRVEGHTDDRPIRTAQFSSNWELSTARATAVVEHLASDGAIAPVRLSAAGYGEFHPIATNTTDEGRRLNRRVDLVLSAMAREHAIETRVDLRANEGAADGDAGPSADDASAASAAVTEDSGEAHAAADAAVAPSEPEHADAAVAAQEHPLAVATADAGRAPAATPPSVVALPRPRAPRAVPPSPPVAAHAPVPATARVAPRPATPPATTPAPLSIESGR